MGVKAKIADIFKSIQGEGIYAGRRQVFVRFYGCNLDCSYCDTKLTQFKEMTVSEIEGAISVYTDYHSIAFTGGEPLCQDGFLKELLPRLKEDNRCIYLETNGVLYENLSGIIDYVDIIAMDFKLPTSAQCRDYFSQHRRFLKLAKKKEVFVKIVVTPFTTLENVLRAAGIVRDIAADIYFILMPQHPLEGQLREKMLRFSGKVRKILDRVKIIPQMHKLAGIK